MAPAIAFTIYGAMRLRQTACKPDFVQVLAHPGRSFL